MCAQMWSGSRGVSSGRRGAARSRGLRDRVEIVHGGSVARRLDGSRRHGGGTAAARTAAPRQLGGSAARRLGGSGSGGTSTGSRVGQQLRRGTRTGSRAWGAGHRPKPAPRTSRRQQARRAGGTRSRRRRREQACGAPGAAIATLAQPPRARLLHSTAAGRRSRAGPTRAAQVAHSSGTPRPSMYLGQLN